MILEYDRKIRAEFVQGIGRLRAHRRLDEDLHIVIVSDFDLQIDGVVQIQASDITPEAATTTEQAWAGIQEFIKRWFTQNGQLPTQEQVAAGTGYTQSWISKLAKQFIGGWKQLKAVIYNLINPQQPDQNTSPDIREQQRQTVEAAFADAMKLPSIEIAQGINRFIQEEGWQMWLKMVSIASYSSRLKLIAALFRDGWGKSDSDEFLNEEDFSSVVER